MPETLTLPSGTREANAAPSPGGAALHSPPPPFPASLPLAPSFSQPPCRTCQFPLLAFPLPRSETCQGFTFPYIPLLPPFVSHPLLSLQPAALVALLRGWGSPSFPQTRGTPALAAEGAEQFPPAFGPLIAAGVGGGCRRGRPARAEHEKAPQSRRFLPTSVCPPLTSLLPLAILPGGPVAYPPPTPHFPSDPWPG